MLLRVEISAATCVNKDGRASDVTVRAYREPVKTPLQGIFVLSNCDTLTFNLFVLIANSLVQITFPESLKHSKAATRWQQLKKNIVE
jgi:hypothetical protein